MSANPSATNPPPPVSPVAVTAQIISIVIFTFICYLTIGLPLAILPGYVHLDLGFSSLLAGVAISVQYVATLLSRPLAGRMADAVGPRRTVLYGLTACAISGAFLFVAALTRHSPWLSLTILLAGRLVLGFGESWVGTGAILWGIGKVGSAHTAQVISWNGITTYGALALGAPLGVVLERVAGFSSIGILVMVLAALGAGFGMFRAEVPIIHGERMAYRQVFAKILPHGIGLALGSAGFGAIATFITLFYASRNWPNAAFSLTAFGVLFIGSRLMFSNSIKRHGGFRIAIVSFATEAFGLALLGLATQPAAALLGAALAGLGFAMVFPALGVEAVGLVPPASRGAALSAYSVFLDLALGITGPLAGLLAGQLGYPSVFLCAALASVCAVALTVALSAKAGGRDSAALT